MLIDNLLLYEDRYAIRINEEGDTLFYAFDYDVRSADANMAFQHFHPFFEMCIFLCPNAVHFIEGVPYEVQAYDMVGLTPNRMHQTQYPSGKPCRRLIIQFNLPRYVAGLSNEYEQLLGIFQQDVPIFRFDSELRMQLCHKLNEIYNLAQKTDPMRNLIIHQKFIEFLTLLYLNQEHNHYQDSAEMPPTEQKIYAITSYIHSHYSEDLSLDMLAEKFYISNYYLSHRFKEITGFSVTEYIQMTRVRNVQALLINTDTPITEIAGACGFNSFSQFNRVFRKYIGLSPSQYRQQQRNPRPESN